VTQPKEHLENARSSLKCSTGLEVPYYNKDKTFDVDSASDLSVNLKEFGPVDSLTDLLGKIKVLDGQELVMEVIDYFSCNLCEPNNAETLPVLNSNALARLQRNINNDEFLEYVEFLFETVQDVYEQIYYENVKMKDGVLIYGLPTEDIISRAKQCLYKSMPYRYSAMILQSEVIVAAIQNDWKEWWNIGRCRP
jgi:hypothetical protein